MILVPRILMIQKIPLCLDLSQYLYFYHHLLPSGALVTGCTLVCVLNVEMVLTLLTIHHHGVADAG